MEASVVLRAVTNEALAALGRKDIAIRDFPFRIGRESRFAVIHGRIQSVERRKTDAAKNNEVYLVDNGDFLQVSREHFQIERTAQGQYEAVDRGSTCGTVVDGELIGEKADTNRCPLKDGSTIVVGAVDSPYVFKFLTTG